MCSWACIAKAAGITRPIALSRSSATMGRKPPPGRVSFSAPKAIASSASPARIIAAAPMTAVLPDAQAFSTLIIGRPCRPIFINVFCAKHGPW